MNGNGPERLRLVGAALALIAVIALTGVFANSDSADAAGSFSPESTYAVADATPGTSAEITSTFNLPEGDYQFGATVNFIPAAWGLTPGADIPDGAISAHLSSVATLGLIGGGCRSSLGVEFDLLDATIEQATTIPFEDPQVLAGNPGGDTDGDLDDQFDVGTDGLPLGVTRYPDYLTRIFKDPSGATLIPLGRLYGQTVVAGIDVSLGFLLFSPGTVFKTPSGDEIGTDPRMGYPSVTVLQALGDPDTEPTTGGANAITDFCSPLDTSTTAFAATKDNPDTAANEGGVTIRTNPAAAGTYNYLVYAASGRDADGDGYENGLDPCPLNANPEWDPRAAVPGQGSQPGDTDIDGIPDSCDPAPNDKGTNSGGQWDHDSDQYGNRTDNCPLLANSKGQKGGSGPDNQKDSDSDGIGDQCDPNPTNPDTEGERIKVCLVSPIDIGGGGTPPSPAPQDMQPCDPNAALPADQTPTPGTTPTPGATPTGTDNGVGNPGVGALAPAVYSIPTWATIVSALGGAGLLGSLGTMAARIFGIRRRRD